MRSSDFDCRRCEAAGLQEPRGCAWIGAEVSLPYEWEHNGERVELHTCPRSSITPESIEWLDAYGWLKQGFLPNDGTWMDQPARLIAAFDVIENTLSEARAKDEEKRTTTDP